MSSVDSVLIFIQLGAKARSGEHVKKVRRPEKDGD